jgi:hypothetical protein
MLSDVKFDLEGIVWFIVSLLILFLLLSVIDLYEAT